MNVASALLKTTSDDFSEGRSVQQKAANTWVNAFIKRVCVAVEISVVTDVTFFTRNKSLNNRLKVRKLCQRILNHETVMRPSKMCIPNQCATKSFTAFVFKLLRVHL